MNVMNIHTEPWHTLIILDACRYDCFEEIAWPALKAEKSILEKRWSTGANTGEWIVTQLNKDFSDVYYISANPWINRIAFKEFLGNIPWRFKGLHRVWINGWEEKYGTVHPWAVSTAARVRPLDERLIVHFMQPHVPFISELGKIYPNINKNGWVDAIEKVTNGEMSTPVYTEWRAVKEEILPLPDAIAAYKETLRMAVPYIADLIAHRPGRTVISADHGDEFGEEEGFYGHPGNYREAEALRTVPWMMIET